MPYNDEGNYSYQVEVPAAGDSLRKAAFSLAHDVETYLFNHNHPGYQQLAFLDWAVQHFLGTHQSSGMLVNQQFRWDPKVAGQDVRANHTNEDKNHASWTAKSAVEDGIRYSRAAMDREDIDTSVDVVGEAELYDANEVYNPAQASEVNGNAVVVPPRTAPAPEPAEDDD